MKLEKESKLGIIIPWIGFIILIVGILGLLALVFFRIEGSIPIIFLVPVPILFIIAPSILATSFKRIWELNTNSSRYRKVFILNLIGSIASIIAPTSLLIIPDMYFENFGIYFLMFILVWLMIWLFVNFKFNKKYKNDVITSDSFYGTNGVYQIFNSFIIFLIFLSFISYYFYDYFYWIDFSILFYIVSGLYYFESGRNFRLSSSTNKYGIIATHEIIVGLTISLCHILFFTKYFDFEISSILNLILVFASLINIPLGYFIPEKNVKNRILNSLAISTILSAFVNLLANNPPLDDSYLLPIIAFSLLALRILKFFPIQKENLREEIIYLVTLLVICLILFYFDLFIRINYVSVNFGNLAYFLGILSVSSFAILIASFSKNLDKKLKLIIQISATSGIILFLLGFYFSAISYRSFSYENLDESLKIGGDLTKKEEILSKIYSNTRSKKIDEYSRDYKLINIDYLKFGKKDKIERIETSLFNSSSFKWYTINYDKCKTNQTQISEINFQFKEMSFPYRINISDITISNTFSADDLMELSKSLNSPIQTSESDKDVMNSVSRINLADDRYLHFYFSDNKIKSLSYIKDSCEYNKKYFVSNDLFTEDKFKRIQRFKPEEFVIKIGTKSYSEPKEGKVKQTFLGGEVISVGAKMEESGKIYYYSNGWISEDNLMAIDILKNHIKDGNHRNGTLDQNGKNPKDFIMQVGYKFLEKNEKYFLPIIKSIENGSCKSEECFRVIARFTDDFNLGILVKKPGSSSNSKKYQDFRSSALNYDCYPPNNLNEKKFNYFRVYSGVINKEDIFNRNEKFSSDLKLWLELAKTQEGIKCNHGGGQFTNLDYIMTPMKGNFTIDFSVARKVYEMCGGEECFETVDITVNEDILDLEYKDIEFIEEKIEDTTYFMLKDNYLNLEEKSHQVFCQAYNGTLVTKENKELFFNELSKNDDFKNRNSRQYPLCIKNKEE